MKTAYSCEIRVCLLNDDWAERHLKHTDWLNTGDFAYVTQTPPYDARYWLSSWQWVTSQSHGQSVDQWCVTINQTGEEEWSCWTGLFHDSGYSISNFAIIITFSLLQFCLSHELSALWISVQKLNCFIILMWTIIVLEIHCKFNGQCFSSELNIRTTRENKCRKLIFSFKYFYRCCFVRSAKLIYSAVRSNCQGKMHWRSMRRPFEMKNYQVQVMPWNCNSIYEVWKLLRVHTLRWMPIKTKKIYAKLCFTDTS